MPTYLSASDFKLRWTAARIDDLSGSDDSLVDSALEEAEREVEGVLVARYGVDQLPTLQSETPGTVQDVVSGLALVLLYRRRGYDQPAPDAVLAESTARTRLSRIARGLEDLNLSTSPAVDRTEKKFAKSRTAADKSFDLENGPLLYW